jgi:hypothetical protein
VTPLPHDAVPLFVTVMVKVTVRSSSTGFGVAALLIAKLHGDVGVPVIVIGVHDWPVGGALAVSVKSAQFW